MINLIKMLLLISSLISAVVCADCNELLQRDIEIERYQVVDEQWVVDTKTGLMWSRCPLGYELSGAQCERDLSEDEAYDWQQALIAVNDADLGGFQDWRLPNRNELESIVERACFLPAINTEIFPGNFDGLFWTATPNSGRADASWVVNFASGEHRNLIKTESGFVRPVRDY